MTEQDDGVEREKLKDIFALIDSDGGGTISIKEVLEFVGSLPQPRPTAADVEELMAEIDADGSGEIDQDEFCGLVDSLQRLAGKTVGSMIECFTRKCYLELFKSVEGGDGDGEIGTTEVKEILGSVRPDGEQGVRKLTDEDIRRIVSKYDEDKSGKIGADEFAGIVSEVAEGMPVSVVVKRFEKARADRAERMRKLRGAFQQQEPPQPTPRPKRRPTTVAPPPTITVDTASEPAQDRRAHDCAKCAAAVEAARRSQEEADALREQLSDAEEARALLRERSAELDAERDRVRAADGQLADLRAELKKWQRTSLSASSGAADAQLLATLQQREEEVQQLRRECSELRGKLRASVSSASSNDSPHEVELAAIAELLWVTETACEARGRDADRLRDALDSVADALGEEPAAIAVRQVASQCGGQRDADTQSAFAGPTADKALSSARRASRAARERLLPSKPAWRPPHHTAVRCRLPPPSPTAPAVPEDVGARLREAEESAAAALQREAAARQDVSLLRAQLATARRRSATPSSSLAERRADDGELRRLTAAVAERDKCVSLLSERLDRAHEAILASAGVGWESELRLTRAKTVLQQALATRTSQQQQQQPQASPGPAPAAPRDGPVFANPPSFASLRSSTTPPQLAQIPPASLREALLEAVRQGPAQQRMRGPMSMSPLRPPSESAPRPKGPIMSPSRGSGSPSRVAFACRKVLAEGRLCAPPRGASIPL